jgi:conjugative transfer signal peptidase TraF
MGRRVNWSVAGKRRALVVALFSLATASGLNALQMTGIRINITDSMPHGFYQVRSLFRPPRRGDTVAVCPPSRAASLGRDRGYLGPGICPGNVEPLLKFVAANGGDIVTTSLKGVTINGQMLPKSDRLRVDELGRPLSYWSTTANRLPTGEIWLYAPSSRSWDSRYWGPVPIGNVLGFADRH